MQLKIMMFFALLSLTACSERQLHESVYHALKDKECMDTQGYPDCDKDRPDFNEYEKQRHQVLIE